MYLGNSLITEEKVKKIDLLIPKVYITNTKTFIFPTSIKSYDKDLKDFEIKRYIYKNIIRFNHVFEETNKKKIMNEIGYTKYLHDLYLQRNFFISIKKGVIYDTFIKRIKRFIDVFIYFSMFLTTEFFYDDITTLNESGFQLNDCLLLQFKIIKKMEKIVYEHLNKQYDIYPNETIGKEMKKPKTKPKK